MKIPRWLIAAMLVFCVALSGAAVAVRLVWSTKTGRQFVVAVESGQFELANSLLVNGQWHMRDSSIQFRLRASDEGSPTGLGSGILDPSRVRIEIVTEPVSLRDVFKGSRRLRLVRMESYPYARDSNELWFEAGFEMVRCELRRRENRSQ